MILRLAIRGVRHDERDLRDPGIAREVRARYGVEGGPVLVVGRDVVVGTVQILKTLETLPGC